VLQIALGRARVASIQQSEFRIGLNRPMTHSSTSILTTERIAAEVAARLTGGECIALNGDLGAGKTHFVRGLVKGLGASGRAVSSPTYVLLNVYDTPRMKVYHLDAYRVNGADDFDAIGFGELLDQGGVVVVEWASRVTDLLPADRIDITLEVTGENARTITVVGGKDGGER